MMGADPTRMERRPGPNNLVAGYSSSSSEDNDEDDYYGNDDVRRYERVLSELHGEAADEDDDNKKKGKKRGAGQTDQEIANEYAGASAKHKSKQTRITLQPEALVGTNHGLLVLQKTFPSKLQNFMPSATMSKTTKSNMKTKSKVDAAALFSRKLVSAYFSYCNDLFPSFAPEDVLLKIESFGSKKQVKDYQQHLREEVRNAHLERIYGLEKAESMIRQLQEGLLQQPDVDENEDGAADAAMPLADEDDEDHSGSSRSLRAVPREPRDKENADPSFGLANRRSSGRSAPTVSGGVEEELSLPTTSATTTATGNNKRRKVLLSNEEEEVTYENEQDDNGRPSPKGAANEQQPLVRPNDEANQTVKDQENPVSHEDNGSTEESSDEEEATFDDKEEDEEKKECVNKDDDSVVATTMNKEAPPHDTPSDNLQNVGQEMGEDGANDKPAGQPAGDMEAQDSNYSDKGLDGQEPPTAGKDNKGEEDEVQLPLMMEIESNPGPLPQTEENTEENTVPQVSDTRDSTDPMAVNDEDKNNDTQPITGDAP
jgi:hypothetical protein